MRSNSDIVESYVQIRTRSEWKVDNKILAARQGRTYTGSIAILHVESIYFPTTPIPLVNVPLLQDRALSTPLRSQNIILLLRYPDHTSMPQLCLPSSPARIRPPSIRQSLSICTFKTTSERSTPTRHIIIHNQDDFGGGSVLSLYLMPSSLLGKTEESLNWSSS